MAFVVSSFSGHEHGPREINPGVVVRLNDKDYIVVRLNRLDGNDAYGVYDADKHDELSRSSWCLCNGYTAKTGGGPYMHHSLGIERPADMTIDHINWQKTDNRIANIRLASQAQQNANRKERVDCTRNTPPPPLVAAGITTLPRGMRYDASEAKFVFADHPFVKSGVWKKSATGSKSAKLTLMERFQNCLESYIEMLSQNGGGEEPEFVNKRIALGREYNDIVMAAHRDAPTIFASPPQLADIDLLGRDDLAEAKTLKLRVFGESSAPKGGAKNKAFRDIDMPNIDAVARIKGDDVFLYDARHKRALQDINFDISWKADDKLVTRYGVDKKQKLNLSDFVYRVLEKKDVPAGQSVLNFNKIAKDVRTENLYVREGGNSIGRVASSKTPDELREIMGSDYLPLNVKIENTKRGIEYKLERNGRSQKFRKITTHEAFESNVLSTLRQWYRDDGADFDAEHARFQQLISSYDAVVASVA